MIEPVKMATVGTNDGRKKEKYIGLAIAGDKNAYSKLILGMENKLYRISRSVLRDDADCDPGFGKRMNGQLAIQVRDMDGMTFPCPHNSELASYSYGEDSSGFTYLECK